MILSTIGPSLTDFTCILSSSFETVSQMTTSVALGYCIGALISGLAFQYFNRQLIVIIFVSIASIVIICMPFTPSLTLLLVFGLISSFGNGTIDAAQNTWFIEMWQQHSNSILQLAQFMLGLGEIIGPLIEGPYLSGETIPCNSTGVTGEERKKSLITPFTLMGAVQLSSVILLAILFCYKKYEPPKYLDQENQNQEKKLFEDASKSFRIFIIFLMSLCLGFYISLEYCHFGYLVPYAQYVPLKISASDGAWLLSLVYASYTIFRAIGAFVAIKFTPGQMMIMHYIVIVASNIVLLLASDSTPLFYTSNIVLGAGFSVMWGSIFSFAERYLVFDNLAGTMLVTASGGSSMVSLFFVGKMIESNPNALICANLINISISIAIFIIINIIIVIWSKKKSKHQEPLFERNHQVRMVNISSL